VGITAKARMTGKQREEFLMIVASAEKLCAVKKPPLNSYESCYAATRIFDTIYLSICSWLYSQQQH